MALDFLAGCAGGKEAGGARGQRRGRREPESRGPEPCVLVGRSARPSGLPSASLSIKWGNKALVSRVSRGRESTSGLRAPSALFVKATVF